MGKEVLLVQTMSEIGRNMQGDRTLNVKSRGGNCLEEYLVICLTW